MDSPHHPSFIPHLHIFHIPIFSAPNSTSQLTMFTPPEPDSSPSHTSNSLSHLFQTTFSYDGNVMLAAIISLLLVLLFVLLLHLYAKWFLAQARQRRRSSMSVSHVLGPSRFHNFHTFTFDTSLSDSPTKGLDLSIIAEIPIFVYSAGDQKHGLECVICLSVFEDNDVVRNLPKCGHAFHVECIDMWLHSHSSCPICRAPVVGEKKGNDHDVGSPEGSGELSEVGASGEDDGDLEIVIEVPGSDNNVVMNDSLSESSSSSSSPVGCSLKRMLSRNKSERKIHPSFNVNELEA